MTSADISQIEIGMEEARTDPLEPWGFVYVEMSLAEAFRLRDQLNRLLDAMDPPSDLPSE